MNRKQGIAALLVLLALLLTGCASVMDSESAYIAKARQVIPVSDAETIDIRYAGAVEREGKALLWCISGGEYQAHTVLPMECSVADGGYRFERAAKPVGMAADAAYVRWQGGVCFCIDNADCALLRIADENGTRDVEIDTLPKLIYNETVPSEFVLLDADGAVLQ